jgi:hypothetical protein
MILEAVSLIFYARFEIIMKLSEALELFGVILSDAF